jgi:RNA polymerase sigma factor (sigma-70 family)
MRFKSIHSNNQGDTKQIEADEARFAAFRRANDKRNNERALAEYYEVHENAIYLFSFNLLQSVPDAEDVTAKSFHALWENKYDLESPKHVLAYLFLVARNAATDILRKRTRTQITHQKIRTLQDGEAAEGNDLDRIEAEVIAQIFAEVQKLPERMRDIFILTYLRKMPASEVSEVMGIAPVTVYTICQRAMKRLKLVMLDKTREAVILLAIISLSIPYL